MSPNIFYITDRHGSLDKGLGVFLKDRTAKLSGLSLSEQFLAADFYDQLAAVRQHFDQIQNESIPVIANSYGCYLLMNSLIGQPQLKTKVLMLSPVLGSSINGNRAFMPAHRSRIPAALEDGSLLKPDYLQILVGDMDTLCDMQQLQDFSARLNVDQLTIAHGESHLIDKAVVQRVVDEFILLD